MCPAKTKGAFTSDMALMKLIYPAIRNIEKKWDKPLQNWALTVQQLSIKFGNRLALEIGGNPQIRDPGVETLDSVEFTLPY